ncbi:MAG: helix-turn-helix domain-containing protein [Thermodesulfobacteriota bacterium]
MKQIGDQTYYEILEVSPAATMKEIQMAYDHAKETFHSDSLAIYSLFSEEEIREIRAAIEEAYRVLADEALRKRYDQSRFQAPEGPGGERPPDTQGSSWEKKMALSFTDLSTDAGTEVYRGKVLRQIRERMGVDLKTVSVETRVNMKILEWIEEEALDKLPPLVYLKGFLRGYAQSLGLDPQRVVEGYMQFLNESKQGNSK